MDTPRKPASSSNHVLSCLMAFALLLPLGALRAQQADMGWPRDIPAPGGTLTIYQPQAEALQGNVLTGRAAASADSAAAAGDEAANAHALTRPAALRGAGQGTAGRWF